MSLLPNIWGFLIVMGKHIRNTLGNKQKIPTQKILSFLRERNKSRLYQKNKEKNKYKVIKLIEYFKIPSYEKLLNGKVCSCFCHDHGNMCYIKETKLCKTCPC